MARKKKNEKTKFHPALIPVIIFSLYFLIAFRTEISTVFNFWFGVIKAVIKELMGIDAGILMFPPNFAEMQHILRFNFINGFLLVFISWLFLAALQTLLPAASLWMW